METQSSNVLLQRIEKPVHHADINVMTKWFRHVRRNSVLDVTIKLGPVIFLWNKEREMVRYVGSNII